MTDFGSFGLDGVSRDPASVVTVGTFDGVHLGHRDILEHVVSRAAELGGTSTVVTFDPHPREVMTGQVIPLLTSVVERRELLATAGIQRTVVIPFTRSFARLGPDDFIAEIVCGRIGCAEIVVGHDHAFGRNRAGDVLRLRELGARVGFSVAQVPARQADDAAVSSSLIRRFIVDAGDVSAAARWLGRNYSLSGHVVAGDGRGRTIGFPTANLELADTRKAVPLKGVYAVRVRIAGGGVDPDGRGRLMVGMMNIGFRPTFGDADDLHLEVHIIDFDADLYGRTLHIEFVRRLREERKFESVEELREQLRTDKRRCSEAVSVVS